MTRKILFVDDEETTLKALTRYMTVVDVDTEYFTSAAAALDYLGQQQIDIVVSDLKMSGMDGIEFLKEVQKSYPDINRVLLSVFGSENMEIKQALEERTVEQYFSKPWELLAYLRKLER